MPPAFQKLKSYLYEVTLSRRGEARRDEGISFTFNLLQPGPGGKWARFGVYCHSPSAFKPGWVLSCPMAPSVTNRQQTLRPQPRPIKSTLPKRKGLYRRAAFLFLKAGPARGAARKSRSRSPGQSPRRQFKFYASITPPCSSSERNKGASGGCGEGGAGV